MPPFAGVGLVVLVLLLCGLGLPLPEEIPIIAAAYLAFEGDVTLPTAIVLVLIAVLIGDSTLYWIGWRHGNRIFTIYPFRSLMTENRVKKANHLFHRWGNRVVFIARFVAGVRATVFLTAGILKMPYKRFILLDGIAAGISIPLNMIIVDYVLHYVGDDTSDALKAIRKTGRAVMIGILMLVVLFSIFLYFRRKSRAAANKGG
jgi:membrane protein DedA with SNARE-associated domain